MLTARGWWFLALLVIFLLLGVVLGIGSFALVCITILLWFLGSWLSFNLRVRWAAPGLAVERQMLLQDIPVESMWAKSTVLTRVELTSDTALSFPHVLAIDRVPSLARWKESSEASGFPWAEGRLNQSNPIVLEYSLYCPSAGRLRFFGLKLQIADLQGFFTATVFVAEEKNYRVLPALVDDPGHRPLKKRHNLLPLLGSHRHLRPGTGSELLDLRDYQPGDPPKMIAWKASARRDKLITKEFESEVPIRSTLFVDTSQSVRVGPIGQNALARLLEIASAVLYANAERRDLTGICLLDETGVKALHRPARGSRALHQSLRILADASDLAPTSERIPLDRLIPFAYGLAQDLYSERVDDAVNQVPWWWPSFWPRQRRWRKKLASLCAVRYGLGPAGLTLLVEDDPLCRHFLQRFLGEHQFACPMPLYDAQGRYLFAAPEKVTILSRALLHAVARGQENEVFVLLVDLLEIAEADLEPLYRAVRMASARHHQVVMICPWPAGVPLPGAALPIEPSLSLQEVLFQAHAARLHDAFARLKREFARRGVAVLCASQKEAVSLILQRIQHLRGWQTR